MAGVLDCAGRTGRNVAIVAVLLPVAAALGGVAGPVAEQFAGSEFPDAVDLDQRGPGRVQPAPRLPDGRRGVLRAVLAMFLPYARATNIAAACGQVMAVLFGIVGFFTNWMLMLVAFFVYFAARGEAQHVQMRSLVRGARVREAMVSRFRGLSRRRPYGPPSRSCSRTTSRTFPWWKADR